jgi:spore germination protein KC
MNKKSCLILLMLFVTLTLTGCWDRQELENLGLVQALGLDWEPDHKNIAVTAMIAIPSKLGAAGGQGGGGGGDDSSGVMIVTTKAPSIYEAFNVMNTSVNREITLRQNQLLVFGEAMAKFGIKKMIDNLVRFREMRRTLLIFICQGQVANIFNVKPKLEKNPAEYLSDLVNTSAKTAMYPRMMFNEFMGPYEAYAQANFAPLIVPVKATPKPTTSEVKRDGEASSSKPDPEPTELRIIGTAVFHADKVVGNLDIYESQVLQLLTNHFDETMLTINDPRKKDNQIAFRLLKSGPATQIKYRKQAGRDTFFVKINLEAEVLSIQSNINYTAPKEEALLARNIARTIKNRVDRVIAKTQQQFKSDIFGFGIKVRNTMLTTKEWENYHWQAKYPDAAIHTTVKINIRRVGVQFQPPQHRP